MPKKVEQQAVLSQEAFLVLQIVFFRDEWVSWYDISHSASNLSRSRVNALLRHGVTEGLLWTQRKRIKYRDKHRLMLFYKLTQKGRVEYLEARSVHIRTQSQEQASTNNA